jgi:hypothetical protein
MATVAKGLVSSNDVSDIFQDNVQIITNGDLPLSQHVRARHKSIGTAAGDDRSRETDVC